MSQGETLIEYAPVRRAGAAEIDTFRCLPVFRTADGHEFGTDVVLGHKGDIESTAERNAAILRLIFKALTRAQAQGAQVDVIVPVNSVALANRAGATVIHDVFAELDAECHAALVIDIKWMHSCRRSCDDLILCYHIAQPCAVKCGHEILAAIY